MRIVSTSRPSSRQKPFSWATLKGRSEMEIPVVENLTLFNCADNGVAPIVKNSTTRTGIYPIRISTFSELVLTTETQSLVISFLRALCAGGEFSDSLHHKKNRRCGLKFGSPEVLTASWRCHREWPASPCPNKAGLRLY